MESKGMNRLTRAIVILLIVCVTVTYIPFGVYGTRSVAYGTETESQEGDGGSGEEEADAASEQQALKELEAKRMIRDGLKGSGTVTDPYQIWTAEDLGGVCENDPSCYILMQDIDLKGADWRPIGYWDWYPFIGYFDGNGHVIKNFYVGGAGRDSWDTSAGGLFGFVEGRIENLGIENITSSSDLYEMPSFADKNNRKGINFAGRAGGLAGVANAPAEIINCYYIGPVQGVGGSGGLIGMAYPGTIIENCCAIGNVNGATYFDFVWDNGALDSQIVFNKTMETIKWAVPNLVGMIGGALFGDWITAINSTADFLTGFPFEILLNTDKDVDGRTNTVGGIVGSNVGGTIRNSYASVKLDTVDTVIGKQRGGIAGKNVGGGSIENCYYNVGFGEYDDYLGSPVYEQQLKRISAGEWKYGGSKVDDFMLPKTNIIDRDIRTINRKEYQPAIYYQSRVLMKTRENFIDADDKGYCNACSLLTMKFKEAENETEKKKLLNQTAATGSYEDGTERHPYHIHDLDSMLAMQDSKESHFLLCSDVDFKVSDGTNTVQKYWWPVGRSHTSPFKGSLKSNGAFYDDSNTNQWNLYNGTQQLTGSYNDPVYIFNNSSEKIYARPMDMSEIPKIKNLTVQTYKNAGLFGCLRGKVSGIHLQLTSGEYTDWKSGTKSRYKEDDGKASLAAISTIGENSSAGAIAGDTINGALIENCYIGGEKLYNNNGSQAHIQGSAVSGGIAGLINRGVIVEGNHVFVDVNTDNFDSRYWLDEYGHRIKITAFIEKCLKSGYEHISRIVTGKSDIAIIQNLITEPVSIGMDIYNIVFEGLQLFSGGLSGRYCGKFYGNIIECNDYGCNVSDYDRLPVDGGSGGAYAIYVGLHGDVETFKETQVTDGVSGVDRESRVRRTFNYGIWNYEIKWNNNKPVEINSCLTEDPKGNIPEGLTAETYRNYFGTEPFAGGDGTKDDPYIIKTMEHLRNVKYFYKSAYYYELGADIDMAKYYDTYGEYWTPIGTDADYFAFEGVFDGNGHAIKKLKMRSSGAAGLFGYCAGTIRDLVMIDVDLDTTGMCAGGIAAQLCPGGVIDNCKVTGTKTQGSRICTPGYAGGMVGVANYGSVILPSLLTFASETGSYTSYSDHSEDARVYVFNKYTNKANTSEDAAQGGAGGSDTQLFESTLSGNLFATNMTSNILNIMRDFIGIFDNSGVAQIAGGVVFSAGFINNILSFIAPFVQNGYTNGEGSIAGLGDGIIMQVQGLDSSKCDSTYVGREFANRKFVSTSCGNVYLSILQAVSQTDRGAHEPEKNEDGVYMITNANELAYVTYGTCDDYILMNDIYLQPCGDNGQCAGLCKIEIENENGGSEEITTCTNWDNWAPLCRERDQCFEGDFDGNGHTIYGLDVHTNEAGGLFGYILGDVHDLKVVVEDVDAYGPAGGLAAAVLYPGSVERCAVVPESSLSSNDITGGANDDGAGVGGLVGIVGKDAWVSDCYAHMKVNNGNFMKHIDWVKSNNHEIGVKITSGILNLLSAVSGGVVTGAETVAAMRSADTIFLGNLNELGKGGTKIIKDALTAVFDLTIFVGNMIYDQNVRWYDAAVGGLIGELQGNVYDSYAYSYVSAETGAGETRSEHIGNLVGRVRNAGSGGENGAVDDECFFIIQQGGEEAENNGNGEKGWKVTLNAAEYIAGALGDDDWQDHKFTYLMGDKEKQVRSILTFADLKVFYENEDEQNAAASEYDGAGTQSDPYIIETAEQFMQMFDSKNNSSDKYFKIDENVSVLDLGVIDSAGKAGFAYDCDDSELNSIAFKGNFDGSGCTIKYTVPDIRFKDSSIIAGLFPVLQGSVKNLAVKAEILCGDAEYAGAIAGIMQEGASAEVIAVTSGSIIKGETACGGIAGRVDGNITIKNIHIDSEKLQCVDVISLNSECKKGVIAGEVTQGKAVNLLVTFMAFDPEESGLPLFGEKANTTYTAYNKIYTKKVTNNNRILYENYVDNATPSFTENTVGAFLGEKWGFEDDPYLLGLSYYNGSGTKDDPIKISNAQDFRNIVSGSEDNIKYYLQTDDFEVTNNGREQNVKYIEYDGDGHTIVSKNTQGIFNRLENSTFKNCTVTLAEGYSVAANGGILTKFATNSLIFNCTIDNSNLTGNATGAGNGNVAGEVNSTDIVNCHVTTCSNPNSDPNKGMFFGTIDSAALYVGKDSNGNDKFESALNSGILNCSYGSAVVESNGDYPYGEIINASTDGSVLTYLNEADSVPGELKAQMYRWKTDSETETTIKLEKAETITLSLKTHDERISLSNMYWTWPGTNINSKFKSGDKVPLDAQIHISVDVTADDENHKPTVGWAVNNILQENDDGSLKSSDSIKINGLSSYLKDNFDTGSIFIDVFNQDKLETVGISVGKRPDKKTYQAGERITRTCLTGGILNVNRKLNDSSGTRTFYTPVSMTSDEINITTGVFSGEYPEGKIEKVYFTYQCPYDNNEYSGSYNVWVGQNVPELELNTTPKTLYISNLIDKATAILNVPDAENLIIYTDRAAGKFTSLKNNTGVLDKMYVSVSKMDSSTGCERNLFTEKYSDVLKGEKKFCFDGYGTGLYTVKLHTYSEYNNDGTPTTHSVQGPYECEYNVIYIPSSIIQNIEYNSIPDYIFENEEIPLEDIITVKLANGNEYTLDADDEYITIDYETREETEKYRRRYYDCTLDINIYGWESSISHTIEVIPAIDSAQLKESQIAICRGEKIAADQLNWLVDYADNAFSKAGIVIEYPFAGLEPLTNEPSDSIIIGDFDNTKIGIYDVTVYSRRFQASDEVRIIVTPPLVESVAMKTLPSKVKYPEKSTVEDINLKGAVIELKYIKELGEESIKLPCDEVRVIDIIDKQSKESIEYGIKSGKEYEVILEYGKIGSGVKCSFDITGVPKTIEKIEVCDVGPLYLGGILEVDKSYLEIPGYILYTYLREGQNLRGKVRILYDNGEVREVDINDKNHVTISGFNKEAKGEQKNITITCGGHRLTYPTIVTVSEPVSLSNDYVAKTYRVGDTELKLEDEYLWYVDESGYKKKIMLNDEDVSVSFDDGLFNSPGSKTADICYNVGGNEYTLNLPINVAEPLAWEEDEGALIFNKGDDFNTSRKLTYTDANGNTRLLSVNNDMVNVSGFDSTTAGEKQITISIEGDEEAVLQQTVYVADDEISMSVFAPQSYALGEELDLSEIKVKMSFTVNNQMKEIEYMLNKNINDFQITGFDPDNAGEQTLTIRYIPADVTVSYDVCVGRWTLIQEPTKLTYQEGDSICLDGGRISRTNADGTTEVKDLEDINCTVRGYLPFKTGQQNPVIEYEGSLMGYNVQVNARQDRSVTDETIPADLGTQFKGEDINFTVGIKYGDGILHQVPYSAQNAVTVSGYDKNKLGTQQVTINLGAGKTTTRNVLVKEVKSISVNEPSSGDGILFYVDPSEHKYDFGQQTTRVTYSDNTTENIRLSSGRFRITGLDTSEYGEQQCTVETAGKEAEFTVSGMALVIDEISNAKIVSGNAKEKSFPQLLSGLKAVLVKNDGKITDYYTRQAFVEFDLSYLADYLAADESLSIADTQMNVNARTQKEKTGAMYVAAVADISDWNALSVNTNIGTGIQDILIGQVTDDKWNILQMNHDFSDRVESSISDSGSAKLTFRYSGAPRPSGTPTLPLMNVATGQDSGTELCVILTREQAG